MSEISEKGIYRMTFAVPLFIDIFQSDCVSLKPKNFHTGELCEPAETKVLFLHHVCLVCYLTCGELAFYHAC